MKLVATTSHTFTSIDARSFQVLLVLTAFVCAFVAAAVVALLARPGVESFFAAMNANTLLLFGGPAH